MWEEMNRFLEHGASNIDFPTPHGSRESPTPLCRFFLELEFIKRHQDRAEFCAYTGPPPHMQELSILFPRVHFLVFGCTEYMPDKLPNVCTFSSDFSTDIAMLLRVISANKTILICSPEEPPMRQLVHHNVTGGNRSLLCVREIQEEFVSGDLVLPIYEPLDSQWIYIDAPRNACLRLYDPKLLLCELAHFHVKVRGNAAYDKAVEAQIMHGLN